jgi:hypothetical protein
MKRQDGGERDDGEQATHAKISSAKTGEAG